MHRFFALSCFCFALAFSGVGVAQESASGHLRLKDRLDRPHDGYCLDIPGVGRDMQLQMPIFAHNCKSGLTPDSAMRLRSDHKLEFAAVSQCITVAGINGKTLPGSAIILRPCGYRVAFFDGGPLQTFSFKSNGQLVLSGTNLCLAVGAQSDVTYSPTDRWRVLSVEDCEQTPARYIQWEFNMGPFPSR